MSTIFANFAHELNIFLSFNIIIMKKIFFTLMAVAAMTLTSCVGKTETPGQASEQAEAPAASDDIAAALEKDLNSGNPETFKARLAAIIEKVQELVKQNPDIAKEYLSKAQQFIKANADKVKALVGDNSELAGLVSVISEADPASFINSLTGTLGQQAEEVKDAAEDAVGKLLGN
jgi:ABC-type transporter Mla subunit MlaD